MTHEKIHKTEHEKGGADELSADIATNTTAFDRLLSALDDTIQKALETIDETSVSKEDPVSMAGWRVSPVTNGLQNILGWYRQTDIAAALASAASILAGNPGYNSRFVFNLSGAVGAPFTLRLLGIEVDEDDDILSHRSQGTTTSTAANKLIDSGATFQTDEIAVGQAVYNVTDDTWAEVVTIDSEIQLTLDTDIMASGEVYDVATKEDLSIVGNGYIMSTKNWIDAPRFVLVESGKSATADIYRAAYWRNPDALSFIFDGARLEWFPSGPTWDIDVVAYHIAADGSLTEIRRFDFDSTETPKRAGDDEPGMARKRDINYTIPGSINQGLILRADDQTNIGTFYLGADIHE